MKKTKTVALLAAAWLAIGLAPEAEAKEIKTERTSLSARGLDSVDVEHPVGKVRITGTSGDQVRIEMRVHCGRWFSGSCAERGERLELETDVVGDTLLVRIDKMPNSVKSLAVDLDIDLPRHLDVSVEHGVGGVRISGMAGDIEVELGVGDVRIDGRVRDFERVSAEVGVGDADFRAAGHRAGHSEGFLFLANTVEWDDGPGESEIEVEIGVGDATIRLD